MDTPRRSYWHTAPRSALRNVSNGQSASIFGLSSFNRQKTPAKKPQDVLSASAKKMHQSIRRDLSKSYGDLSNLRPKSPPIQNLRPEMHGFPVSPGKYVDDTQSLFSPSYSRRPRQAIPSGWITSASGKHPPTITKGSAFTGQQVYHSLLHGMEVPRHVEVEPATISIQGLTSGYIQPLDFCVPVTRSHPGDEGQRQGAMYGDIGRSLAVEHVNISTAWNGLSDVDATELFRVHQVFVATLERMLANELWQIYHQLQQQDSTGNIRPIHTSFSAGVVRGISFCRDQLVSEMAEALYLSKGTAAKAKSGFLRLYLVATDTLVQYQEDGSRDTSITIRMRCYPSSLRPYPVVDAAWVPDSLLFKGLDEFPLEGQRFSIVPRYHSKSAFRPTRFPENVKYSIESEPWHSLPSWLVWSDEIAGFEGIVPFYSEANGYDRHVANSTRDPRKSTFHSLKIIVQAVLVDDNGSSVRYERILRVRLTIKVVPWYMNGNPRETKERFSVPKAYQDTRLASTAHRFALQGRSGSPLCPERFPSGLLQRTKEARLDTPIGCVHTDQVGSRDDHSITSSSATGTRLNETDSFNLTQTQAYLVAKCAKLTSELEDVKGQVMMSSPSSEHSTRMLQASDLQNSIKHTYCVPFDHHTGRSSASCISHRASDYLTTPSSPSLRERHADLQLGPIGRFSALPPPAIGLRARPRSNSQIEDGATSSATRTGRDSTPEGGNTSYFAASRGLTFQNPYSTKESGPLWRLPEQASVSLDKVRAAFSPLQQHSKALSISSEVKGELETPSTSGKRSDKRRTRSILNNTSPSKRPEETGTQPQQDTSVHFAELGGNALPILGSDDEASCGPSQRSGGIFYNSFGPLRDLRSPITLADEVVLASHASERGASTNSSGKLEHRNMDSGCYENADGDELARKNPASSGPNDRVRTVLQGCKEQVHLCPSPSASSFLRHASISSSSDSRSTSSDMDFIVERDPRAREVSRQEQAKSWRMLSRPDSNKKTQLGPAEEEVRLSEDEKKAIHEAMQRSLDDLAEGFDDIFLENSSESNSGNGDL